MTLHRPLLALVSLLGVLLAAPLAAAGELPLIKDLRSEARLSQQKQLPILVMFSSDHCVYCTRLEEDFLKPMHNGGFYDDKVIIRRVKMGSRALRDLDGSKISGNELAERYGVSLTPTLVFIDHQGRQLAQNLVGLTTPDFYGGYLDEAIDTSLAKLRRAKPLGAQVTTPAP